MIAKRGALMIAKRNWTSCVAFTIEREDERVYHAESCQKYDYGITKITGLSTVEHRYRKKFWNIWPFPRGSEIRSPFADVQQLYLHYEAMGQRYARMGAPG